MKNIMKAAHQLTKEIKNKYPEVNYAAQLGLCMSYLSNETETEVKLAGTPKQVAWAESIRSKRIAELTATLEAFKGNQKIMSANCTQLIIAKIEKSLEAMNNFTEAIQWIKLNNKVLTNWEDVLVNTENLSGEESTERERNLLIKMFRVVGQFEYAYHNKYGYLK